MTENLLFLVPQISSEGPKTTLCEFEGLKREIFKLGDQNLKWLNGTKNIFKPK